MKLPYWSRILIGALLGLGALAASWLVLGIPWVTAAAAALLAPVGFLGSYFLVSADRPEEGYEQVLFDRPNTIAAVAMILLFAGAGVGTGLLSSADAPASPADNMFALRNGYLAASTAWGKDAQKDATVATLGELRTESDRIAAEIEALPEGDARTHLETANDAMAFAIDALKGCAEKEQRSCMDARLNAADAEAALEKYKALAG
ncbi:MAG TPA: hypothetical protein VM370_07075 [Candidatus Thermoplasmatota archaeon]|nr:hypothetical protein [Candidatus Thermoplasmatota archaeon]